MSKATKLLHTRYRVNDLERTVRFYKDVLGLEETRRHKSPRGSELVFMKAPRPVDDEPQPIVHRTQHPGRNGKHRARLRYVQRRPGARSKIHGLDDVRCDDCSPVG